MADARPLGVFDSGVGGLTVVRAINRLLPHESVVYLGDTARVPYGNKSSQAVQRFAREDTRFLLGRGVKAVVVACNTASAYALELLQKENDLAILGVIQPGVEAALARTRSGHVGIIGTAGTIASRAYQDAIAAVRPDVRLIARATPLLVPLIEENWLEHRASRLVVEEYIEPLLREGVDTLVLACTHYPLISDLLRDVCGNEVELVDSATTCAEHTRRVLDDRGLLTGTSDCGVVESFLTDTSEHFAALAGRFLDRPPGVIHQVRIDE